MRKIVMTICLCFCIYLPMFCQINISFDHNCLRKNAAIVSKAIIRTFGEDTVKQLLENETRIVFVCKVDSTGHLLNIEKIWTKHQLPSDFIPLLEDYLQKSEVHFFICIVQDFPDVNKSRVIEEERIRFQKNNSTTIGSVAFPGYLMDRFEYEYEREKAEAQGFNLSKYDYLLSQIEKYITE